MRLFVTWFIAHRQQVFTFTDEEARLITPGANDIRAMSRAKYFADVLPMLQKVGT